MGFVGVQRQQKVPPDPRPEFQDREPTSSFQRFFSISPGFDCLVANALCPKADSFSPPRCFDTNYMKRDTRRGPWHLSTCGEGGGRGEGERTKGRLMLSSALAGLLAPPLPVFAIFLAEFRPHSCETIFGKRARPFWRIDRWI